MKDISNPKCPCGHDQKHPWVGKQAKYTFSGWLLICCGVSALPKAVETKCGKCGFVFQSSDDLELRKANQF